MLLQVRSARAGETGTMENRLYGGQKLGRAKKVSARIDSEHHGGFITSELTSITYSVCKAFSG